MSHLEAVEVTPECWRLPLLQLAASFGSFVVSAARAAETAGSAKRDQHGKAARDVSDSARRRRSASASQRDRREECFGRRPRWARVPNHDLAAVRVEAALTGESLDPARPAATGPPSTARHPPRTLSSETTKREERRARRHRLAGLLGRPRRSSVVPSPAQQSRGLARFKVVRLGKGSSPRRPPCRRGGRPCRPQLSCSAQPATGSNGTRPGSSGSSQCPCRPARDRNIDRIASGPATLRPHLLRTAGRRGVPGPDAAAASS